MCEGLSHLKSTSLQADLIILGYLNQRTFSLKTMLFSLYIEVCLDLKSQYSLNNLFSLVFLKLSYIYQTPAFHEWCDTMC